MTPVISRRQGLHTVHCCRFCARSFRDPTLATRCAVDCRAKFEARYQSEMQLREGGELPPPPKRQWRSKSQVHRVKVPLAKSLRKSPAAVAEVSPKRSSAQLPTVTADVRSAPPPAPPDPELEVPKVAVEAPRGSVINDAKKKPEKPFYRDGAEYVCTVCSKKYYTKIEVQACFDGHPD